jgi:hypothetical protein
VSQFRSVNDIDVYLQPLIDDLYQGNLPRVPWDASCGLKILDTIGSLQWQTTGEQYTPYQETTQPLHVEEEGPPT